MFSPSDSRTARCIASRAIVLPDNSALGSNHHPMKTLRQCPNCARKKTGQPGVSFFSVFGCESCSTQYCDATDCGAAGCPKCKSRKNKWLAKVRSNPLFEFSTRGTFDAQIARLAQELAQTEGEDWGFGRSRGDPWVLSSYVTYTFARLQQEKKINVQLRAAAFNTGLVTDLQEDIYALFKPTSRRSIDQPPWQLEGFFRSSDHEVRAFRDLELATYFRNPADVVFDTELPFQTDLAHIVRDNKERFPEEVRKQNDHFIVNSLKGAIEHARIRVRRNYKTAIPQWYGDRLQLLLPLCFVSPSRTDLAICVRKDVDRDGKASYVAKTALTLEMAYCNARLITKPDREWLKPSSQSPLEPSEDVQQLDELPSEDENEAVENPEGRPSQVLSLEDFNKWLEAP